MHIAPTLIGRLAPVLASAVVLAALGCREEAESPMAPEAEPAIAATAATALTFRQVSAGGHHSCGVTTDNQAFCWGEGAVGELGDGTETSSSIPVPVAGDLRFLRVNAGESYTCGVTTDNRAYCWGDNSFGQLGDGTHFRRLTPVPVAGGHRFPWVDAGLRHTCGVTTDHRVFCWGDNFSGQLGNGTNTGPEICPVLDSPCSTKPLAVVGGRDFRNVSAGSGHTCGVKTNDRAFCWGDNSEGQLGSGVASKIPIRVAIARRFRVVRAGGTHSCGLTTGDRVYCWGAGEVGQLGNATETSSSTPVRVLAGGRVFSGLSADDRYTCGVTPDSRAFCWGINNGGQLGRGTITGPEQCAPAEIPCSTRPVAVVGGLQLRQADAGLGHTCGVTTDNRAFCWGLNSSGQLGNGTNTGPESCGEFAPCSSRPVAVAAPRP